MCLNNRDLIIFRRPDILNLGFHNSQTVEALRNEFRAMAFTQGYSW